MKLHMWVAAGFSSLLLAACGSTSTPGTQGGITAPDTTPTTSTQLPYGTPITPAEVEALLNDPKAPPALVLREDGEIVKNRAYLEREALAKETGSISPLQPLALCDQMWGANCTISTSWTYKGYSTKDKSFATYLINTKSVTATLEATITKQNTSGATGGFNAQGIMASLNYSTQSTFSTKVAVPVPPNSRVDIYSSLTGEGGYGTQYKYPMSYASCYQAGAECLSSNFSAFGAQGIGYELR